jgi:hypothetical protein
MKNTTLILIGVLMFGLTNLALASSTVVDGTPLSTYVSLAEWNTDGDYEDWVPNNITNDAVVGGSLTGVFATGDAQVALNLSATSDPRYGAAFARTGTIIEVRIRYKAGTAVNNMSSFNIVDPFGLRAPGAAWNPTVPTDGNWHIYQLTMEQTGRDNAQCGLLKGMRFDPNSNTGTGEGFEIDYIRVGGLYEDALTVDGQVLINYASLGEWNTDGDFEGWSVVNCTGAEVTNGYITGVPSTADPQVSKDSGLPPVGLSTSRYVEIRMKQIDTSANYASILWTISTSTGWDSNRQLAFPDYQIIHDGAYHIYRMDMSAKPFWKDNLDKLRFDPYSINASQAFEIDYVRTGSTVIPEPAFLGLLCVLGLAFLRRK